MQNQSDWTPPPPPDDSIFGAGTRDHYAAEIRTGANKALAFGILSIFCCPPIFAYMAYTTAEEVITNIDLYQVEEGKRSLAQIGKALAIAGVVLWVIGVIFRVATIR